MREKDEQELGEEVHRKGLDIDVGQGEPKTRSQTVLRPRPRCPSLVASRYCCKWDIRKPEMPMRLHRKEPMRCVTKNHLEWIYICACTSAHTNSKKTHKPTKLSAV